MKVNDLDYVFPDELIATSPLRPSRVMWVDKNELPTEISIDSLLDKFSAGDVLVLNNTKVLKRRVFAGPSSEFEVLFLKKYGARQWDVLFPSKKFRIGDQLALPLGLSFTLLQKGRPQRIELSEEIDESYFQKVAELPVPPYIQKARQERHTLESDSHWYQTAWAKKPGSFAAPTASFHFSLEDMSRLKKKGVIVAEITLHVGLGTFLPITTEDLDQHDMHEEFVEISSQYWAVIQKALEQKKQVWALGTTSMRALESAASGLLFGDRECGFSGFTKLLIQPGFSFKVVTRLLTNFHQPRSTLLALVAAFSSLERVKTCYQWAIERKVSAFFLW